MLIHGVRILLGNKVIGYFDVEQFLFLFISQLVCMLHQVGLSMILLGPFRSGCNF